MWSLKIKYKHSDCIYTDVIEKLGISVQYYALNNNNDNIKSHAYSSSLQIIRGKPAKIDKYYRYLKNHKDLIHIERHGHIFHVQIRHKKDKYSRIYDQEVFDPSPSYFDKGYEIMESASWDKNILDEILKGFQTAKTKLYCEVIHFKQIKPDDIYIAKIRPKLPLKQLRAFRLAQSKGYYNFPRKTNLGKLAQKLNISKSTLRENLRKAEAKVIPLLLSDWGN